MAGSELITHYVRGLFSFAIVFIAGFIAFYSYQFLTKTVKHRERRPWDFLFVASILFLFFEIISLFVFLGLIEIVKLDLLFWSKVSEFLYSGFVLLAFISQHDLIINNHLILISKKDDMQKKVVENVQKELDKTSKKAKSAK
ncbi:hypothetical protein GOV10_05930 [Candidatus Woesearchaeota archaeon]|nr:hypothetical protein [Candidatus Woesearchaeota archaeon]